MLIRDIIPPLPRRPLRLVGDEASSFNEGGPKTTIHKQTSKKALALFTILFLILQFFAGLQFLFPKQAKAAGTTYYVDSSIIDTNPTSNLPDFTTYNPTTFATNTGSASVYKTIADVNLKSFSAGDSILFRRGQTWREQLTVPSSGDATGNITFGAYGDTGAAKPVIKGSDAITSWAQATGDMTGAVTQANMRLSTTTGVAFVDFSSAGALTNYLGYQLVITDSVLKTITGYIKAAGTGETYGAPQGANPGMEGSYTAGVAPNNVLSRGTASEYTADPHGGTSSQQLNNPAGNTGMFYQSTYFQTAGKLIQASVWSKVLAGSGAWNWNGLTVQQSVTSTSWAQSTAYATQATTAGTSITFYSSSNANANVNQVVYDDFSVRQVNTPSATGVTITSTANGSTYNWTSTDADFKLNDTNYTYSIVNVPTTAVWDATVTTQPNVVWFNGTAGTLKTSKSALASPGDWYWAANVLSVYSVSSPTNIEASSRANAILANRAYITISNISFINTGGSPGTAGSTVQFGSGSSYGTVDSCDFSNAGIQHIGIWGSATGNYLISNNTFAYSGLSHGVGDGSAIDVTTSATTPLVTVEHNTFTHIGDWVGSGYHNHGIYFKNGRLIWRYNYQYNGGVETGASVKISGSAQNGCEVYDNIISSGGGTQVWGILSEAGSGHLIYNNVFYGVGLGIWAYPGSSGMTIKNNIFHTCSLTLRAQVTTNFVSDNNVFYNNSATPFYWGATQYNFADWKTNSSQDGNSINASDPLFVSTSDFHLQSTSSAIDVGANVGLASDYAGVSVPRGLAPEIGAYEYPVPLAPTIGTPETLSDSAIRWNFTDNSSDEDGFSLTDSDGNAITSGLKSGVSYIDETILPPATSFTRKIKAYNSYGSSPLTNSATATTRGKNGGGFLPPSNAYANWLAQGGQAGSPQASTLTTPTPQATPSPSSSPTSLSTPTPSTGSGQTGQANQTNQNSPNQPFTKYLRFSQADMDVKRLQIFLNQDSDTRLANSGPGSLGKETNLFGRLTFKAVIKFQEKYTEDVLAPWKLTKGTGFVGKTTTAKINKLLGF